MALSSLHHHDIQSACDVFPSLISNCQFQEGLNLFLQSQTVGIGRVFSSNAIALSNDKLDTLFELKVLRGFEIFHENANQNEKAKILLGASHGGPGSGRLGGHWQLLLLGWQLRNVHVVTVIAREALRHPVLARSGPNSLRLGNSRGARV